MVIEKNYVNNHLSTFVIDQEFGDNWAFYNGDCVWVMSGLPDKSINLQVESPPFAKLYIYSDSVADMGNASDDEEFFKGYSFALREKFRIAKDGSYTAIHCKDLMRYMSSHGYSGQDDFPGHIIEAAENAGWTFQRWITIWKNPVVEMQRTKTYGLLHKSFATRAEVVRQGAPDMVLIFRKIKNKGKYDENEPMPVLPESVKNRARHLWTVTEQSQKERLKLMEMILDNKKINRISDMGQYLKDHLLNIWNGKDNDENKLLISSLPLSEYTDSLINYWSKYVTSGRLCLVHCKPLPRYHNGEIVGYYDMMGEIIKRFEAQGSWKFHTRIVLTDGTYLVGFRNWTDELRENYKELNGQVVHNLKAPKTNLFVDKDISNIEDVTIIERRYLGNGIEHPDYIGNDSPTDWHDSGYYSILVWQKYASPAWYDLDGLPDNHPDCWMNISQTNVLNFKAAKDPEDQKHICPLQLDLIERLILEYSEPGDIVFSPYGGISSESYTAVKLDRKAISSELKASYWKQGVKYLKEIEKASQQAEMEI